MISWATSGPRRTCCKPPRWLLEARYILDYSDGELARELGVKPDSVRMALTRARRKARRLMESQHNEQNV